MTRRHPEFTSMPTNPKLTEMEKELERIKDRLRNTENELAAERNNRSGGVQTTHTTNLTAASSDLAALLSKQIEEKNAEIRRIGEELKKNKNTFGKEVHELNEKNAKLEKNVREMEEKLGKQSHVGWMKDDIDMEKDTVIKMSKENEELKKTVWKNNFFCFGLEKFQDIFTS